MINTYYFNKLIESEVDTIHELEDYIEGILTKTNDLPLLYFLASERNNSIEEFSQEELCKKAGEIKGKITIAERVSQKNYTKNSLPLLYHISRLIQDEIASVNVKNFVLFYKDQLYLKIIDQSN